MVVPFVYLLSLLLLVRLSDEPHDSRVAFLTHTQVFPSVQVNDQTRLVIDIRVWSLALTGRLRSFPHLCSPLQIVPFPGSIAMTAFLHASLFCANFGSSWCSFILLRTLSIHLSPGLHFPFIIIFVTSFAIFLSPLLIIIMTIPRNAFLGVMSGDLARPLHRS